MIELEFIGRGSPLVVLERAAGAPVIIPYFADDSRMTVRVQRSPGGWAIHAAETRRDMVHGIMPGSLWFCRADPGCIAQAFRKSGS